MIVDRGRVEREREGSKHFCAEEGSSGDLKERLRHRRSRGHGRRSGGEGERAPGEERGLRHSRRKKGNQKGG